MSTYPQLQKWTKNEHAIHAFYTNVDNNLKPIQSMFNNMEIYDKLCNIINIKYIFNSLRRNHKVTCTMSPKWISSESIWIYRWITF